MNLALGDAIPALLTGNTVVVKPSELTPLATRRAIEAMNTVLPANVLQTVIGYGDTGAALVDHVDMICVTGSPETGRRVMERASRRLTPVLLELGGKDPMIVLRDADLDRAAKGAAWGGCMMTGQVPSRRAPAFSAAVNASRRRPASSSSRRSWRTSTTRWRS